METLQAIFTRRSIRKYKSGNISDEQIQLILRAGMQAPTARDTRSCHFVAINERSIMEAATHFHPYAAMLKKAALAIAVCGDRRLEPDTDYLVENASAATQNILLAAHDLGLGAVWLGVHPREKRVNGLTNLLGLPDFILPVSLASIGIPAEEKPEDNRYDVSKIIWNKWV